MIYQTKKRTKRSKIKRNESVVQLRRILGSDGVSMTQKDFAQLVGVSVIAIKKIECGTLPLSGGMARRIYLQTGVSPYSLRVGDGKLLIYSGEKPYDRSQYDNWREMFKTSPDRAMNYFDTIICPHMMLMILAAARPAIGGKVKDRLIGLMDSWAKWEKEAVEAFGLKPQINDLLKEVQHEVEETKIWGDWRRLLMEGEQFREQLRKDAATKTDINLAILAENYRSLPQQYNFKDNSRKRHNEQLKLTATVRYYFEPGLLGLPVDIIKRLRESLKPV